MDWSSRSVGKEQKKKERETEDLKKKDRPAHVKLPIAKAGGAKQINRESWESKHELRSDIVNQMENKALEI